MPPNMSVRYDDTVAGIHAFDGFDDFVTALLDVIVGTDGDGLDLRLRPDHVFESGAELNGKPPVGDENEADHRSSPRALVAPHERAHMLTIQNPSARGLWAF